MGERIAEAIEWVAGATDFVAAVIILLGFARGLVRFIRAEVGSAKTRGQQLQEVRCQLGTYLLLGLEFMIVSDILHSCVHRDFESLGELGALVVIRTVISYFLGKELEHIHKTQTSSEQ